MRPPQAKWSRLTQDDLAATHDQAELVAKVEARDSLLHWVAVRDVELWAKAASRKYASSRPREET